jgi:hypothetical protein
MKDGKGFLTLISVFFFFACPKEKEAKRKGSRSLGPAYNGTARSLCPVSGVLLAKKLTLRKVAEFIPLLGCSTESFGAFCSAARRREMAF